MIRIGTSGYSFSDWRGTAYPKKLKSEEMLSYYEQELGFDCVEINSTYYAILNERAYMSMAENTGNTFEFTVKGYRGFTHDPFDGRLKENRPSREKALEHARRFNETLEPLRKKNKLASLLLQFPVFFTPSRDHREYILALKNVFAKTELAVEFRNSAWISEETFGFLQENRLIFCSVDEPALPRLVPFVNRVTAQKAYFRLHGRNKEWFNAPVSLRYDYSYSDEELEKFVPEIKKMNTGAKKSYVFFNNCHKGYAVKNALTLKERLGISSERRDLFSC